MNKDNYRDDFINKLYKGKVIIKIKMPVIGFFKMEFGQKEDNEEIYNTQWVECPLKINDNSIIIKHYIIKYDNIKSVELIEPSLFSSGYIELHDFYNNYLQIKSNNNHIKQLFDILNEKLDN